MKMTTLRFDVHCTCPRFKFDGVFHGVFASPARVLHVTYDKQQHQKLTHRLESVQPGLAFGLWKSEPPSKTSRSPSLQRGQGTPDPPRERAAPSQGEGVPGSGH